MFKKIFLSLMMVLFVSSYAHAYDLDRSDENYFKRVLSIETRGLVGVLATPAELVRTPMAESKEHKYLWPITSFPRLITNVLTRVTSSVYDVAFSPLVQIFTNDTTPITHAMGLPDYPWQVKDESF